MSKLPLPAYAAISAQLRREISAGTYANGRRLPTEAELAERYKVSRQTVRRAFHDLVSEAIVSRVPGRGTFVNDNVRSRYLRSFSSIDDLLNLSRDTAVELLKHLERGVDSYAASRLQLDTDVVHSLVLRRCHDGLPFVTTSVSVPAWVAKLLQGTPDLQPSELGDYTIIGLLEPRLPSPISRADQSITTAPATPLVAEALKCKVGDPMLRIDRLYLDQDNRPIELAVSYFLPDRYTHRTTLRRVKAPEGAL
jgi:GntR family transcriptional regulator